MEATNKALTLKSRKIPGLSWVLVANRLESGIWMARAENSDLTAKGGTANSALEALFRKIESLPPRGPELK